MRLSDQPINLLWTGGWDSTFRLCTLLLKHKAVVQPFYINDENRPSTPYEFLAMEHIRASLREQYQIDDLRLLPVKVYNKSVLEQNAEITRAFKELIRRDHLGGQYEWLARFCNQYQVDGLELCIHVDDQAARFIESSIEFFDDPYGGYYRLAQDAPETISTIFKYFRFPIITLTKTGMEQTAGELGFREILLKLTWFCHKPASNGTPCGICYPCQYTIEEGLSSRFGPGVLTKYRLLKPYLLLRRRIRLLSNQLRK